MHLVKEVRSLTESFQEEVLISWTKTLKLSKGFFYLSMSYWIWKGKKKNLVSLYDSEEEHEISLCL